MAREELVLCDVGGEPEAESWTLIQGERRWEVDVCAKHAAPLLKIAEKGRSIMDPSAPRSRVLRTLDKTYRG